MKSIAMTRAFAWASSISGVSNQLRQWVALFLLAVGVVALPSPAAAQAPSYSSFTSSPPFFTNPGEKLVTTITFNSGNRVFSGLTMFDLQGVAAPDAVCTPSSSTDVGQVIVCTASYTIQPTDVGLNKTLRARIKFSALGTPITMAYITTTASYIPTSGPPTVTSVTPTAGPVSGGTTVTVNGTNLNGVTGVSFGGTPATSYTMITPTQLSAIAPAGSGTVDIKVSNTAGTSATSAADQYTYVPAPIVSAVSPTQGTTAGGNAVVITGANFSSATAVAFGGATASFTVNSGSQITATAPAGTGTVDVRVTNPGGVSATGVSDQYTYVATPTVTAIAPTSGPTAGGTTVVLTGTNLAGASAVTFGATPATSFTVNSATQITATAPAGSGGTVDVRVTTVAGTSAVSAADQFTYIPAPTVTSIAPAAGPTTGGTTVVVTGANLFGATAVTFGGVPATAFTIDSATQVTATAPAGAAGTVDVRVTTTGGTSATSAVDQYSYIAAPIVTGISPTAGPNSGGTSVVITGLRFSGATEVTFGAAPATGFTVNSATQITATAPAGVGTVDVRVTTIGGTSATSAADQYSYVAIPTVTSISPTTGPNAGGTIVTVTGTNLSGATAVSFGAAPATGFTVNSATQITATSPAGVGVVDVRVSTAGGTSATSAVDQFAYFTAPVASSFTAAQVGFNAGGAGATTIDLSAHATNAPTSYAVGSATTAQGGSVTVNAAGQASYTPRVGFSGNDSFIFTASNPAGTSSPATVTVPVTAPTLALSPASLPNPGVAAAYSATLTASGGVAPYGFALTGGALPSGLTLAGNGTLSGTPTAAGSFSFTVTATDASTAPGPYTVSRAYAVAVAQGAQTISFANPGAQQYGTSPTLTASATSGLAVSFASSTSGVCTVTTGGALTFVGIGTCTIDASQSGNVNYMAATTVTQSFAVNTPPLAATASVASIAGTVGQPLGPVIPVTASGGQPAYNYTLTGTLPAGLTFSTSTGTVSGTPTANLAAASFPVTVTDAFGQTANASFQLTVGAPTIVLTPATLAPATMGIAYSATFSASGGTAPYSFAVVSGALPAGLTLSSTGTLSGTPTVTGTFNISVRATDSSTGSGPFTATNSYALVVNLPPAPVIAPVPAQTTPGNTTTNIQSLSLVLNNYVSGQYSSISIGTSPAHGTLQLTAGAAGPNGAPTYTARYTPTPGYSGPDSFTFTATGPGGTSSPATVSINVSGVQPSAANLTATATQSVPVTVNLTAGAVGGPYTGATVVSVSPAGSLTTSISPGANGSFVLTATPAPTFDGVATVTYTLSNAFGTSAPATVTFTVAARANPTLDPVVNGVSSAQAEASRRFASTQMDNFQRRMEQLHHGGGAGVSTSLSLNGGDGERLRQAKLAYNVPGWTGADADTSIADVAPTLGIDSTGVISPMGGERSIGSFALWTGGALTIGSRDDTASSTGLDFQSEGVSLGGDIRISQALTVGIGGGFGWDRTDVGGDQGRVRSSGLSLSAYASLMASKNMFIDAMAGMGDLDHDTRRQAINGKTATGSRNGRLTFASVSSGFDGRSGNADLSVYAKLGWLRADLDAYRESGAGIYDLAFAKRQLTSVSTVLGARSAWQLDGWRPHVRAEWRHELKDMAEQRIDYADVGAYRFALGSDHWSRNSFSGEVGSDVTLGKGLLGSVDFGGGLGDGTTFGTARLTVSKDF